MQAPGRGVRKQPGACAEARPARHAWETVPRGTEHFPKGVGTCAFLRQQLLICALGVSSHTPVRWPSRVPPSSRGRPSAGHLLNQAHALLAAS